MLRNGDGPLGLPVGLVALALVAAGAGILLATPFRFASVLTQLAIGFLGGGVLVIAGIVLLTDDLAEAATHFRGEQD